MADRSMHTNIAGTLQIAYARSRYLQLPYQHVHLTVHARVGHRIACALNLEMVHEAALEDAAIPVLSGTITPALSLGL